MTMRVRRLGRTSLAVSEVGFGAAPLGDLYHRLDDAGAIEAVSAAHAAGISLFDTSPLYGAGLAEHRCGTALRRVPRESFLVSTKVGRRMDPLHRPAARGIGDAVGGEADGYEGSEAGGVAPGYAGGFAHATVYDYSFDGALRSAEQSLLRLGLDRLDILLIHDVDAWTHGEDGVDARFREAMTGAYPALLRLRDEGVVGAIGVGVNDAGMCARFANAGDFDAMMLAGRYSLLEQPALDRFLPLAQSKGIGVMLGGVFNSGILATGAVPGAHYNYAVAPPQVRARVDAIDAVCRRHGVALAAAAMHFSLAHPAVSSIVLGAVRDDEVRMILAWYQAAIPDALWQDLKASGLLRADAPTPCQPPPG